MPSTRTCSGSSTTSTIWAIPNDADGNCPYAAGDPLCVDYWDLGWTWSKPAIARIGVYFEDGGGNVIPDDVFVAFFGGGWDRRESDLTGNFFYAVDLATGATVVKENIGVSVPGSPAILDSDNDGFHDKVYFGDTNGGVYRIQYPSPFLPAATGADAGILRKIFDASVDLTDPVASSWRRTAPAAAVLRQADPGAGAVQRRHLRLRNCPGRRRPGQPGRWAKDTVNNFYVVLDDLDNDSVTHPAYTVADLAYIRYDDAGIVNTFTPIPTHRLYGNQLRHPQGLVHRAARG